MPKKDEGAQATETEQVDRQGDDLTGLSPEDRERQGGAGGAADEEVQVEDSKK